MDDFNRSQPFGVIRITREEAASQHVDDLLKRQMSLRGEGGITRDRRGAWYYQNWFIFMVAGLVAAVAAWAIIEPFFDDMLYIQGTVEQLNSDEPLSRTISVGGQEFELNFDARGWVIVNSEKVWITDEARTYHAGRSGDTVNLAALKQGQALGVYVLKDSVSDVHLPLALFIDPDPPMKPPQKATMRLENQIAQTNAASMLLFSTVAALVGLAIGAADGLVCRLVRRVLLGGAVGLLAGFIGGFISMILANLVYAPLSALAMKQTGSAAAGLTMFGFLTQMGGRSLGWCIAGMAMGLGQGLALRSGRLLLYGFLGGVIGGLLGGLLFDPIDLLIMGVHKPSAHVSRLVGIGVIGASVGAMIGIVELLARNAWLRMVEGPLAGKEFLIFKDTMYVGSSPRSDIYLFNDDQVAPQHAVIRSVGDNYEIENLNRENPASVNGRPLQRARLHSGDQIGIGRTSFMFQKRKT